MARFSTRMTTLIWLIIILILSLVIVASPFIPNNIGIVSYQSISGEGLFFHYSDYDTGIRVHSIMPITGAGNQLPYLEVNGNSLEQTLTVNSLNAFGINQSEVIGVYPAEPIFEWAIWYELGKTALVIYTQNSQTGLAQIDAETGDLTPYLTIDDFSAGLISLSPNRNYLLLRETETNFTTSSPPQPNILVDLQTGDVLDLGNLIYAYWSPDSTKIAIGHPTDVRLQASVEIYDIATKEIKILDVSISQGDTSFFGDSVNAFVNAVLWSPDSERLIIHNRATRQLLHIDISGHLLATYDGGRLLPKQWSPNGRYVLTVGYYEDVAGAHIIDTQQHTRIWLNSHVVIQDALADFAWSHNSSYIAVMTRTSGANQVLELTIYGLDGQVVAVPNTVETIQENSFVLRNSLHWIH